MNESKYVLYSTTQEAWDAMKVAILNAKKSIYWEVYILVEDEEGVQFFDLLEKKAREGLDVKLIVDSVGSYQISRKKVDDLKKAGVDIHFFQERKHRYRGIWKRIVTRTHRKILIVDENIGFIGGVNVSKKMKDWLDVQVRMHGKVVRSLLRSFAKSYIICGGDKEKVKHLIKYSFRVRKNIKNIEFVFDDADTQKSQSRKKYIEALTKARERVILFSPYYFPDKKFLFALWRARKRGVKVDLLIPFRSDLRIVQYAAFAWFNLMQKYGVNIHLTNKMMHGKGVLVDDDWAMIGSANLDKTSFYDNYEAGVRIHDKKFVQNLKATLLEWAEDAVSIDKMQWEKRGQIHRVKEWFALQLLKIWHRNIKD